MSNEEAIKFNLTVTWINRALNTSLISIVLYFLIDLHSDFKTVKQVQQSHEVLLQVHSTQIADIKTSFPNLIQNHKP